MNTDEHGWFVIEGSSVAMGALQKRITAYLCSSVVPMVLPSNNPQSTQ
jgi:hypothetical protein